MGIRRLLSQWTTKTLGGSTKLSVDDYHLIQDPVHIQEGNLDAIHLTNAVGQATNTQSSSGAIVGTLKIESTTVSDSGSYTILFQPDAGQVWELIACNGIVTDASGTNARAIQYYDGTNVVLVYYAADTSANWQMDFEHEGSPLYVTNECYLRGYNVGTGGGTLTSTDINCAVVRVR